MNSIKPTFKLYRIIDKLTGKALQGINKYAPIPQTYWTAQGCFWRTQNTIKEKLIILASTYERQVYDSGWPWYKRTSYDVDRLFRYEVETYHVLQLSMNTINANDFVGKMPALKAVA